MNYIATLPKELQSLLDHYVNYERWKFLAEFLKDLWNVKIIYCNLHDKFVEISLKAWTDEINLKCSSQIKREEGLEGGLSINITLDVDQLVTKEYLLDILERIYGFSDNLFNMQNTLINDYLEKYHYEERLIIIPYGNRKIIKITDKIS